MVICTLKGGGTIKNDYNLADTTLKEDASISTNFDLFKSRQTFLLTL